MLSSALASATLSFLHVLVAVSYVSAGQIPVISGTIGGVSTSPHLQKVDAAVVPAATTPGKLRIVENSGVCETTPGVYQASGYGDLTSTESMWYVLSQASSSHSVLASSLAHRFWFFAARSNPDTAPLAIWLNGGVCCSSS